MRGLPPEPERAPRSPKQKGNYKSPSFVSVPHPIYQGPACRLECGARPGRRFNGTPRVTVHRAGRSRPTFAYILNGAVKNADMRTIWTGSSAQSLPGNQSSGFLKETCSGGGGEAWEPAGYGRGQPSSVHLSVEPSQLRGSFPAAVVSVEPRTGSQGPGPWVVAQPAVCPRGRGLRPLSSLHLGMVIAKLRDSPPSVGAEDSSLTL